MNNDLAHEEFRRIQEMTDTTLARIQDGSLTEVQLEIAVQQIQQHLALAWNARHYADAESAYNADEETFEKLLTLPHGT